MKIIGAVIVVVLLVAGAVGATWYVVGGGSSAKTEGRCEYTPEAVSADAGAAELSEAAYNDKLNERKADQATADQNPDVCPSYMHWVTVER